MPLPDTSARRLTIALFWENQERALHFVLEEGDKVGVAECSKSTRDVSSLVEFGALAFEGYKYSPVHKNYSSDFYFGGNS
eukprot:1846551-Amphidinium_carterae.1